RSAQALTYILNNAVVNLIYASNTEFAHKAGQAIQEQQLTIEVYTVDNVVGNRSYQELIDLRTWHDLDIKQHKDAVQGADCLTLIYTSGTIGKPKGVLLTHKNIISNVEACQYLVPKNTTTALSFLPLCHIFERMVVYLYLSKGIQIHYAENLDNIVADINDVKPQIFTTVPRVLEKVYDKIIEKGKALTGIKKALFFWAVNLGHRFQEPPKNGTFYMFKLGIARKLIFSKWREALGGNIKLI